MREPRRNSRPVREQRRAVNRGRAAAARRHRDRGADKGNIGSHSQAAPSRDSPSFRLAVTGQIVPVNPAASVRGPQHIVKQGKTPVLEPAEARQLLDSIDVTTAVGLRDCAGADLTLRQCGHRFQAGGDHG
jgi:hypothetical protein